MVGIITKNASRMFGGTTISRNEEWLKSAADYSMDVVSVAVKLRPYPAFVRPLMYPFLEGSKTLDHHLHVAKKTFSHIFAERLALKDTDEKPVDMLQWLADSARGSDRNPDVLAHNMLFMALASVHTSSATIIHVLFDLCANPEFMEQLRQDVQQAVDESGWTLAGIAKMKKIDSFMKESQRMNQAVLSKCPTRTHIIFLEMLTVTDSDLQPQSRPTPEVRGWHHPPRRNLHHHA